MKLNENVELLSEMKLVGDAYTGAYTNGLTMTESQTMDNMEKVRNDDEEVAFVNRDNVSLRLLKDNQIDYMRVKSEVSNKSDKPIKIEMLSTFVLKKVKADKVHRLQSFWSQEGKLRTEDLIAHNAKAYRNNILLEIQ